MLRIPSGVRLVCLLALVRGGPASAQTDTLKIGSLDQVLTAAIQHNPTQAVYLEQIKQATVNYQASKSYLYPNATGSFNGTDNLRLAVTPVPGELIGKPGTTFNAQFGKQFAYNAGVTFSQSVLNWTSVMRSRIARQNIELIKLQQDGYVQSLREQVARLYFSALVAQSALQINRQDLGLADTLQTLAEQRLREGKSDRIAMNQATINQVSLQQSRAQSQQLLDQSLENLKILLGEKPTTELLLTEPLLFDSLGRQQAPGLAPDKALQVYAQQLSVAELQASLQQAARYPTLSASAFLGGQQFRNEFGLSFGQNTWNAYQYIGLNLSVPLFTGFANTHNYQSAKVQQHIAQLQYANARQQSAITDRLLQKSYTDYADVVKNAATTFRLYGQNLRLNQQKYQEGILSMDGYLKAFQDYLTAENAYLNALSQLLSTQSTILSRQ